MTGRGYVNVRAADDLRGNELGKKERIFAVVKRLPTVAACWLLSGVVVVATPWLSGSQ